MFRNWRKMLGATAVVVGMTVPVLTIAGSNLAQAAGGASDCAPIASAALDNPCVESSSNGSTTAPYNGTVLKGDRIDEFKWLVNEDNSTGDPSFTAANVADCLPARRSRCTDRSRQSSVGDLSGRGQRRPRQLPVAFRPCISRALHGHRQWKPGRRPQPCQPPDGQVPGLGHGRRLQDRRCVISKCATARCIRSTKKSGPTSSLA
jgi:hypothetical protein